MVLYFNFQEFTMENKPIVVDSPGKLLEIHSSPQHGCNSDQRYYFRKGDVRSKIESMLDSTEDYSFLRLAVNPDAIPPVQEYLKELNRKRRSDCNDRYWLNNGTEVHYFHLNKILEDEKMPFVSWPLVKKIKIHNLDVNQDSAFWPNIFFVRHCDESKFEKCLGELHSDEVWKRIVEREAPQNYTLPVLELWMEKRVIPLSIDEKVLRMHGSSVKDAVDFLVQFENEYENTGSAYSFD